NDSKKLSAKKRAVFGKKLKASRLAGELPVVVYGAKAKPESFLVDMIEFKKVLSQAGESSIVALDLAGASKDALIHEVQVHPITGEPIHADFLVVDKNKPIIVSVPLTFEGVAPAIKELGGNLIKVLHEVEIEALPKDLPHDLKVDISVLIALDSQILIKDIILPAGVTMQNDAEEVVASISEAGEVVVEEATEAVDLSAIEVEKKGKKEEEGTEEPAK
ncbi:MAG: 50S ribosomal protein L25, partial [Candidatus Vogelbacteria bacterium]|nr:50S ribosomal protein L25 [Candidatus Vogelbacteria bacterium]